MKYLISREYISEKIEVYHSIAFLRSNNKYIKEVLKVFSDKSGEFYIYFLDGDRWKERPLWKLNEGLERYDYQFPYELMTLSEYCDCVFQWADEFILITSERKIQTLSKFLEGKDYTMTCLELKTSQAEYDIIAKLSHLVRRKKELGRGKFYIIEHKEL